MRSETLLWMAVACLACAACDAPKPEIVSDADVERIVADSKIRRANFEAQEAARAAEQARYGARAAATARRRTEDGRWMRLATGYGREPRYLGVLCSSKAGSRQLTLGNGPGFGPNDTPWPDPAKNREIAEKQRREMDAAQRENRRIIARADFPYPDLCRPADRDDPPLTADEAAGVVAVRRVTGPARDLQDAARRGTLREVRSWIARTEALDTPDAFGRSAMDWASLRRRADVVALLRAAGAAEAAPVRPPPPPAEPAPAPRPASAAPAAKPPRRGLWPHL